MSEEAKPGFFDFFPLASIRILLVELHGTCKKGFFKSKVSALEHRAPLAFTKLDMATAVLGERLGVRPTAGDALLRLRHCFVLPPIELAQQLAFLTV
mgnify:CR=1 FL=1